MMSGEQNGDSNGRQVDEDTSSDGRSEKTNTEQEIRCCDLSKRCCLCIDYIAAGFTIFGLIIALNTGKVGKRQLTF